MLAQEDGGQEARRSTSPAAVYDLKGLNCPLPVLKAKKRLATMQPGSRLWLETTDPLAVIDIPAFCAESGHHLIETAAISGGHRFLVERGGGRAG
ncbi:sulfurtransferase TusA family protein [Mesorhizobium sp.]|uniref:sulfurtransferase TusA family protein n=1 Tax=Mesorhizobium sp. TaxID=1871066 RepID=UPI000FE85122|nr:sulfurtransferase TusA family protein [Mesorhizobium sp.]RWK59535.1 MAG: response regulator SirA [Mesorhizobium sp.]RWM43767.1 MAG: response regulator SirA [Mesorhizobium sp.]RWM48830.1 MAG: response regulator SirA [Mesorhizobium sp.]RWM52238.1 MAG: response regulator SirA [Mesorhizobium sp.]RWM95733.1 MAG: response regulator SirA [Mesorhizobium sp.]